MSVSRPATRRALLVVRHEIRRESSAKRRRVLRGMLGILGRLLDHPFLLALMAWPLMAWGAAELLVVNAELPRVDAIVVLSGAKVYVERAERAAELFHEGRAPIILLTNDGLRGPWSPRRQDNPRFVEQAADEL